MTMKKTKSPAAPAVARAKPTRRTPGLRETAQRKKDTICRNLRLDKKPKSLTEALDKLNDFLDRTSRKHTVEREIILSMLQQLSAPVDIETMHSLVDTESHHICIGTVYNTLQLLVEARLAQRIELVPSRGAFYERVCGSEPHFHAICHKCGTVIAIPKKDFLTEIQAECPKGFHTETFKLAVYGLCRKCQAAIRKAELRARAEQKVYEIAQSSPD